MECSEPFAFPKINKSTQKQSPDPTALLFMSYWMEERDRPNGDLPRRFEMPIRRSGGNRQKISTLIHRKLFHVR